MLELEDGRIAHGDCCTVQYVGVAGRDPLLLARDGMLFIQEHLEGLLTGQEVTAL